MYLTYSFRISDRACNLTLDENAEGIVLHHSQSHHELIISRESNHVSILIYKQDRQRTLSAWLCNGNDSVFCTNIFTQNDCFRY